MSYNNSLPSRGARQLLVKACIDLAFNRIVQLFKKHSDIAMEPKEIHIMSGLSRGRGERWEGYDG